MRNAGLVLPIDIEHLVLKDGSNIKLDISIKYLEEKGLYVIVLLKSLVLLFLIVGFNI